MRRRRKIKLPKRKKPQTYVDINAWSQRQRRNYTGQLTNRLLMQQRQSQLEHLVNNRAFLQRLPRYLENERDMGEFYRRLRRNKMAIKERLEREAAAETERQRLRNIQAQAAMERNRAAEMQRYYSLLAIPDEDDEWDER